MYNNLNLGLTIVFASALLLSGCDRYRVTVNDNEVYTPAPVFADYILEDQALSRCVAQTLEEIKARKAADLTRLNCSSAGVYSLSGLELFSGLTQLNLSDNPIASLSPLAKLPQLQQVVLRNVTSLACEDMDALRAMGVKVVTEGACPGP